MGLISRVSSRTYRKRKDRNLKMFKSVYNNKPPPKKSESKTEKSKSEAPKQVRVYSMLALSQVKSREALFICPFNDAHHVRRSRFMNHIYHCQRNEIYRNWKKCPFHDG